ncbi:MAG TPA: histidine kinase [Bryobacteraceae bacterium]|nr:histidine kinase [Bryobacteraceae bacterium]
MLGGLHATVSTGSSLTADLIHFTTSLLITTVLLVLTLRAARLPGTPVANIFFAVCGILWSAGGLTAVLMLSAGLDRYSRDVLLAQAVQYSGAALFPVAILMVWRPFAALPWQKMASRVLQICALISAAVISAMLWLHFPIKSLVRVTALNAGIVLLLGAVIMLRRRSTPRAVYFPSILIVAALGIAALMMLPRESHGMLSGIAAHFILLTVLCTFLLFARFRLADRFIRYAVRILLAALWAGILAAITTAPTTWEVVHQARFPAAIHGFMLVLSVNALLFTIAFVDERVGKQVNRWLFRAPDYRAESRALGARLRDLHDERQMTEALEDAARRPLELSEARVLAAGGADFPAPLFDGETVERAGEVLVPMATGGRVTHALVATPGPTRPGLVSNDVDYLRAIAALYGNRLDALARERDAIERQSREALLLQQVTEAELRALRAQINPHFLFNSLNTVADLIVRDPAHAETMTLRLASVFRHVLAHSSRPLTTVRDEIEFLRAYLYIEEARFGDRLTVEIAVDPAVAGEAVPSLILQPLVENALKHGLGPKPGPGRLTISVSAEDGFLQLRVEDDGMGLGTRGESQGVGLANVADRLATLYQDRASVVLEAREVGGCRVTVRIPSGQTVTE